MKINKKIITASSLITALSASVVPYAVLAEAPETPVDQVYTDVNPEDDHFEGIMALTELGIVDGYGDGTFGQWDEVTRQQVAVMMYHAANLEVPANVDEILKSYSDVDGNSLYAEQIAAVTEAGIFAGSNGKFNPRENITREQMATVLVQAFDLDDYLIEEKEIHLDNVAASHQENVQILANAGATNQLDDFRPKEEITRGAFATQLHQVMQLTEDREDNFELSIMHMNDTHANLDNIPQTVTAINEVRAEKPESLLLHAGDVFSGTLYFNEFLGEADLKLFNLMNFDAMTFGNHEFDLGSSAEGHQALADFVQGAKFPFVSSNVDFSGDDKFTGLFSDLISSDPENGKIYNGIIKEIDGEEVGIFGLTTEETADIASPGEIKFENYLEEAEKAVKAFENQGVDKIIALTHIGFDDNPEYDNDLTLADEVEGIDVIVGGHSHTQLDEPVVVNEDEEPTVIVQAYQYNDYLGNVDVEFDDDGVVVGVDGELIEIGEQTPDPEAAAILKPYADRVEEVSKAEIGVTTELPLENPRISDPGNDAGISVRKNETILGNLITDGMLNKAKEYNEDVVMAFQNGGGIRAAIDAGPITVGEVITVLPFGNTLATMEVTGAELKEAFEISVAPLPSENGGFLHVAGANVQFDPSQPAGERVVSISYENDDGTFTEIEDSETYTVATNAFTAKGGDGYDVFATAYEEGRVTDLGLSDWENFRDHLVEIGTEGIPTETKDRIVEVDAGETETDADNFELSVMHTNDLHAHVETAPRIATAVKEIRAEKPNALLLDAGDVFQGTLYFTQYEGQADVALMNYLEYDAMTLGNHEFDLGKSENGHQALADFVTKANFPIITANVDFSADEKLAGLHKEVIATEAEPGSIYDGMILEVEGEKIGIFGLTTETTAGSSSPERVVFENYLEEAEKAVASLEEQGVDKIIALTHLGFETPTSSNDSLLATYVDGIDIIVGGHSHTALAEPVVVAEDENGEASDPTVIVQTGTAGANLGTLDVEFDENGVIVGHAGELISVSDLEEDEGAVDILKPFKDGIADVQNEETGGIALVPLENPRLGDEGNTDGISVRNSETALGNLVADSMLSEGKKVEPNATIALQNGGGVRSAVDAGPITMGEVLTVLSFNNGLYSVELTGEELIRVLEGGVAAVPGEAGSFLHTAGLKVEFDSSKPANERIISVEAQDESGNYAPIELDGRYTLITNIYIALGNGYNGVFREAAADGRVTDIGLSDWESFANYLGEMGEVDPQVEGRTVDIAE